MKIATLKADGHDIPVVRTNEASLPDGVWNNLDSMKTYRTQGIAVGALKRSVNGKPGWQTTSRAHVYQLECGEWATAFESNQ